MTIIRARAEHGTHSTDNADNGSELPMLLTVEEAARLLRTTKRAIYAMIARRQLPGVVRIRRRVLVRSDDLLHWLHQSRMPSLDGVER